MRNHHQVLASVSRTAVLGILRSRREPLGVGEVAQHVGLHPNTVRSHLDVLVDSGYAVRRLEASRGPGRPRVLYEATAAPDDGTNYRLLAEVLALHLVSTSERPGEAAVNAGRDWALAQPRAEGEGSPGGPAISEQDAVAQVVRILADSGFAPEVNGDGTVINLHHCPFRELAVSHPEVVCGTHLGIIQGALAELGSPVQATRLIPFVEPDLCITTLTRRPPGATATAATATAAIPAEITPAEILP